MKKILFIFACLALAIGLCACGLSQPEPEPIPVLEPSELVTAQDVTEIVGYTPVLDPEASAREGNTATVLYRSEPIGQYDTVTVKVTQFNETVDYQQIFDIYEQGKAKRSSAELVENLGQESYIAFPTIHVYDRGCLVEITAGSGADEVQKNILKGLAIRAASRLEEIIPEYTG